VTSSSAMRAVLSRRVTAGTTSHAKRRIVFLAGRHAVYQCLSQAAQQYFPFYDISLLDHLPSADQRNDGVSLVLLGGALEWTSPGYIADCRERFPGAAICLLVEGSPEGIDSLLIEQKIIQGILPLSLPLDVWLAIIALLVSGGEYLIPGADGRSGHAGGGVGSPSEVAQAHTASAAAPHRPVAEASEVGSSGDVVQSASTCSAHAEKTESTNGIEVLTVREREILQLVSEGFQNKIIANRMALSEHTVKAHVHNLIAKLRVTNRTQAAACFHDQQIARSHRAGRLPSGFAASHGR